MRWPKYIRVQRQEQVLKQRLKVPPAIALFDRAADKTLANQCFKLFKEYQPPTRAQRKQRLRELAKLKAEAEAAEDGDAALAKLVNMKTATAVCLSQVHSKHGHDLELLTTSVRAEFNDKFPELRKKKGEAS